MNHVDKVATVSIGGGAVALAGVIASIPALAVVGGLIIVASMIGIFIARAKDIEEGSK